MENIHSATQKPERHLLFLFMDGVGLGSDDPAINPFASAKMPALQKLLGGNRLLSSAIPPSSTRLETEKATLLHLDACLQVPGIPQSATGQATLLTGQNVPAQLGYHYGPKPNPEVAAYLRNGNLFSFLSQRQFKTSLLNAYPPRYFHAIESGRRLYSAIPLAVTSAGIPLRTQVDLSSGNALSADFTAEGWHTQLGFPEIPILEPARAGESLGRLARELDFAMFEFWISDYAGHGQEMEQACQVLETFDRVLEGLVGQWRSDSDLILITSDHGNLEDLSTRHHTRNPVPALVIGAPEHRASFAEGLTDLTGIFHAIRRFVQGS